MTTQTKSNWTDICLAGFFLLLGIALLVSASRLPAAVGGRAGAGFFPGAIGGVMVLLSLGLIFQAIWSRAPGTFELKHAGMIAGTAGLIAIYLLLWPLGYFPLRTFVFVTLLLRLLGQSWKTGVAVSLVLTAAVTAAFQYGLNLSLD